MTVKFFKQPSQFSRKAIASQIYHSLTTLKLHSQYWASQISIESTFDL